MMDTRPTLKSLRIIKGMTQKQAAQALHVNPGTLSKWERGLSYPDAAEIKRILALYNIEYIEVNFLT